jgi:DNA-binding response OmpR family regulator
MMAEQLPAPPFFRQSRSEAMRVESLRGANTVESDSEFAGFVAHRLRRYGYEIDSAQTGGTALELCRTAETDLVLLNLDLSDMDGLDVCRRIRSTSDIPLIAVNASASELDCVLGLQAGADDFIAKPFGFRELNARMQALLRRAQGRSAGPAAISHGPLHIDAGTRMVRLHGRAIELTRKEFDLLHNLAVHADTVLSRSHLIATVWGESWSRRTLDTHISSLRSKLGGPHWITTVRGVGFRLGEAPAAGGASAWSGDPVQPGEAG